MADFKTCAECAFSSPAPAGTGEPGRLRCAKITQSGQGDAGTQAVPSVNAYTGRPVELDVSPTFSCDHFEVKPLDLPTASEPETETPEAEVEPPATPSPKKKRTRKS